MPTCAEYVVGRTVYVYVPVYLVPDPSIAALAVPEHIGSVTGIKTSATTWRGGGRAFYFVDSILEIK